MREKAPEWWRNQKPDRAGRLPWDQHYFTGPVRELPAGELEPGQFEDLIGVHFDRAHVQGVTLALDEVHLAVTWSAFESCTFSQGSKSRRGLMASGAAAQGCFGNRPSVYKRCTFRGVRLGMPGRFHLGQASFEDCVFENCVWGTQERDADLVRCRVIGSMSGGSISGESDTTGRRNRISGNDFREAKIASNFELRGQFPVGDQAWPDAYEPQSR
ncbi:MAG: hypothetical protein WC869_16795 [Phycisphaerae bacterium]|jgi:hypothetical protein